MHAKTGMFRGRGARNSPTGHKKRMCMILVDHGGCWNEESSCWKSTQYLLASSRSLFQCWSGCVSWRDRLACFALLYEILFD
jgi:hypothetical protein